MKGRECQLQILYSVNISSKNEGKLKYVHDEGKPRELLPELPYIIAEEGLKT
jgi:hypothetical protein